MLGRIPSVAEWVYLASYLQYWHHQCHHHRHNLTIIIMHCFFAQTATLAGTFLVWAALLLCAPMTCLCIGTGHAQVQHHQSPGVIARVVSSLGGLRLTEQPVVPWDNGSERKSIGFNIDVDISTTYQTMRGFGASFLESGAINLNSLPKNIQEELLDLIFSVEHPQKTDHL